MDKPRIKRKPRGRPFPKGQSGNPDGRPPQDVTIRALARLHTESAVATLIDIAEYGASENARVAAAIALLDRGWGRPGTPPPEPPPIRTFTFDIGPLPAAARSGAAPEWSNPLPPEPE
ncbi:MAG: DUF5681 domain-containing protein [Acetobacteraceae bacterium]